MNDLKSSRENRGSSNQSSVNGDDDDGVGGCGNCGNYLEDDDVQIVENIEAEDAFGENNAFQDTQKNKSNKTDSNRKRSSSDAEACGGEGGMKPESFKHAGPAGKWKQQQQHKPNDHQKNDPIVVDDDDDGDVSDGKKANQMIFSVFNSSPIPISSRFHLVLFT